MANCGWPAIGGGPVGSAPPPVKFPGGVVELSVEPRQHHGAAREVRDGREQARGRRHRAGRTGGDHRRAGCGEAVRIASDQLVAPFLRLDRCVRRGSPASGAARPGMNFNVICTNT